MLKDKRMPYEFDLRVPGYVRGPGLPRGVISNAVVVSIDLVPTFLEIAGAASVTVNASESRIDGRSVLPLLRDGVLATANRSFLVEYNGENTLKPGIVHSQTCAHAWGEGMACWIEGTEKLQPGPFEGGAICS
jgi:hypothetical protein